MIGSTADLKISTNENKEKLTDEILDFSNYKVSKPWGWEIWFTQNIGNTPYALKNIHMEKVKSGKSPRILEKANTRDTKVAKWRNSSDRLEVGNVGQYDMTKGV